MKFNPELMRAILIDAEAIPDGNYADSYAYEGKNWRGHPSRPTHRFRTKGAWLTREAVARHEPSVQNSESSCLDKI